MDHEGAQPESAPRSAGPAGTLKRILLCLGCLVLMAAGTVAGIFLERSFDAPNAAPGPHSSLAQTPPQQLADEFASVQAIPEELRQSEDSVGAQAADTAVPQSSNQTSGLPLQNDAASRKEPSSPAVIDPETPSVSFAEKLHLADELLAEGNHRAARDLYAALSTRAGDLPETQLRLRSALCDEALGNLDEALVAFRRVVELAPRSAYSEQAVLGQARILSHSGHNDMAIATLFRALIENASRPASSAPSQIPHQLALLIARRVESRSPSERSETVFQDSSLQIPVPKIDPQQIIQMVQESDSAESVAETTSAEEVHVVQRYSAHPGEIFVNVQLPRTQALEIVRRVANRCGWNVRLTEAARFRLQERTFEPNCFDLPLALVLDSLLEPLELIWRTEKNAILISTADQANVETIRNYRREAAMRTLRFACTNAPEHPWVAACYIEMGRTAAIGGTLDEAARYLTRAVEQFPRSEFEPLAWFNLGKLELRQGHLTDSLKAFQRAADQLSGHPLEPVAYLYAGRIELENDNPRDAILPLTRALVLAERTDFEPQAALTLSSAYLMLEHYQRANEILIEHRHHYEQTSTYDVAAFLSSLIRYRGSTDERDRLRAGASLVGALTNVDASKAFGRHWVYLVGQAYRDLGMVTEEISLFQRSLESSYRYPLQNRMRFLLLEDAPGSYAAPQQQTSTTAGLHAKELLAEAQSALRSGQSDLTLNLCRDMLAQSDLKMSDRKDALRLMGRVYQMRGEHEFAVRCFTGMTPEEQLPFPHPTAVQPSPGERR